MFYQLTKNKNGRMVLTVAYDPALKNWNDRIEKAIADAGLQDENRLTVIAMPAGLRL